MNETSAERLKRRRDRMELSRAVSTARHRAVANAIARAAAETVRMQTAADRKRKTAQDRQLRKKKKLELIAYLENLSDTERVAYLVAEANAAAPFLISVQTNGAIEKMGIQAVYTEGEVVDVSSGNYGTWPNHRLVQHGSIAIRSQATAATCRITTSLLARVLSDFRIQPGDITAQMNEHRKRLSFGPHIVTGRPQ